LKDNAPSREELFALVWERPSTEVAHELEISDVALGKLCRRLQVPKPPRDGIGDLLKNALVIISVHIQPRNSAAWSAAHQTPSASINCRLQA